MTSHNTKKNIEGFGYTFIEANLFGKPVIGSNIGGISSAIEDKKTGFLVEEGNINEIAEKILLLANDKTLGDELGNYGKERALKRFDIYLNAKHILQIFNLK